LPIPISRTFHARRHFFTAFSGAIAERRQRQAVAKQPKRLSEQKINNLLTIRYFLVAILF
jgi:hypothetical protein